jgi:GxxExxY protein
MGFLPVSAEEDRIGKQIVDAAFAVHQNLGPGLLESIYEVCFCHESQKRDLSFQKQVAIPIYYDGLQFDQGFRVDVFVEGLVICELKAVEGINPLYTAQLITYLKLTNKRLGYLINFNVPLIKNGIKRIVI